MENKNIREPSGLPALELFDCIIGAILKYEGISELDHRSNSKNTESHKISIEVTQDTAEMLHKDLRCLKEDVDLLNVYYGGFVFKIAIKANI